MSRFIRAGVATCMLMSMRVLSAENSPPEELKLEEVPVTASRRIEVVQDVPAAVTVIEPLHFAEMGRSSLTDVLAYVPGVSYNDGGAPGLGSITMRGVTNIFSTASVGIYIDDIPYGSVTAFAEGANFALDYLLGDLQRIEVIKGPQGTLFGASSMGGSLRYITRLPSLDTPTARVSADLASVSGGAPSQLYRLSASAPLVTNQLAARVSGFYRREGGFIDEAGGARNVNDSRLAGGQATLLYKPRQELTVKLNYIGQNFDFSRTNAVPFVIATGRPVLGEYTSAPSVGSPTKLQFEQASMTLDYELGWATAALASSYQKFSQDAGTDLTLDLGGLVDAQLGVPVGTNNVLLDFDITTRRVVEELRLTSPDSERLQWIAGLYYTRERSANAQNVNVNPGPFDLVHQIFPADYREVAGFGDITYAFAPKWDSTLGVRLSHNDMGLSFTGTGLLAGPDMPRKVVKDDVQTYLLNARYRPTKQTSFYGRIASGYRPASATLTLVDPSTGDVLSEPLIKADRLRSYELGAKGNLDAARLSYDLAVYHLKWKDLQVFRSVVPGVNVGGNADSGVTANGVEASLSWRPLNGLMATASAAYARSTLDRDDPSLDAVRGEQVPLIPRWTFAATGEYRFALLQGAQGFVGAGLTYRDERKSGWDGGRMANGTLLEPLTPDFRMPGFAQVDWHMGCDTGHIATSVYVTNVFNRYGIQTATTDTATIGTAHVIRPRTIGAVVTATF